MRSTRLAGTVVCPWLLFAYLAAVVLPESLALFWLAAALGLAALLAALGGLAHARRLPAGTARNLALACGVTLSTLLLVDLAYTIRENAAQPAGSIHDARLRDATLWPGEIHPRRYFPGERGFELYKPGYSIRAPVFGEAYNADGPALARAGLRERALERFEIDYHIDSYGFRERDPLASARVFALGDSYAFGEGLPSDRIWPELLARRIGRPVYNLGISNTSPRQQLMILEHLEARAGDAFRPEHVLWMLFEGNDLEDRYAERAPDPGGGGLARLLAHTPLLALAELPESVRASSVLHRLLAGRLRLRRAAGAGSSTPHRVGGIALRSAVYESERFGPRVFPYPVYIERATRPQAYVLGHPNRPAFDRTLRDMRALADARGMRVSVILAPSAPRLYGRHYRGFPALSERPHFLDYAGERARALGFEVLDLYEALRPYTDSELLYLRDDSHWNERGNELVARLLAERFFAGAAVGGDG